MMGISGTAADLRPEFGDSIYQLFFIHLYKKPQKIKENPLF